MEDSKLQFWLQRAALDVSRSLSQYTSMLLVAYNNKKQLHTKKSNRDQNFDKGKANIKT